MIWTMTTTSEENTRLSVLEAKVDAVASGVSQTYERVNQVGTRVDERINQLETRINQVETRMDNQFREVREGQRQILLAIVTAGTAVTLALIGVIATLALDGG